MYPPHPVLCALFYTMFTPFPVPKQQGVVAKRGSQSGSSVDSSNTLKAKKNNEVEKSRSKGPRQRHFHVSD